MWRIGNVIEREGQALEPARATSIYFAVTSILLFAIIALFVLPLVASTALHFARDRIIDWRNADRSSAGLLPPALPQTQAVVRICFSADRALARHRRDP